MLLRFFRINDPYRLLGVLIILFLLALPLLIDPSPITVKELKSMVLGEIVRNGKTMYAQIIDSTPPLSAYVFGGLDWMFGRSINARHSIAVLVLFFQAALFAVLLISNKAYTENTYLPALIFGVLCFWSYDFLSLSPELFASTALLLALNNLFKEIEFRIQRDEITLNLGVFLGISSLFVFSYIIFLLATVLILILFSRIGLRKILLLIFGFALPHLLLISFYYYFNNQSALWQYFYGPNFTFEGAHFISLRSLFVLGLVPLIYFIFSLFMLQRQARFTKYQSQLFQIMFLWMLFAVGQVFITRGLSPQSFIIFAPPLTYFISHYLLLIRRKWIAETMLWLFLIGIMSMNLLTRNGIIKGVDYTRMSPASSRYASTVHDKRITLLTDDFGLYLHNHIAGSFPDWTLAREIFEHPDYYENVLTINQAFQDNLPDLILDPDDLMKKVFERIPALEQHYQREGEFYRKTDKVSN